jgi:hypothetical protein
VVSPFNHQQSPSSVSKSNSNRPRSPHHRTLRIDGLEMADGVSHIHGDDGFATQRNHHAEAAGGYQIDGGPKRVAKMRSKGEGDRPRRMCPSTLIRTSLFAPVAMALPTPREARRPSGP